MTLNAEANTLEDFILNRMRVSHIYQPVMLKVLLEGNGTATLEEIAKALLSYDLPQIDKEEIDPILSITTKAA